MKNTKTKSSSSDEEENLSHPKKPKIDQQRKQVFVGRGILKGRHLLKALMAEKTKERAL